MSKGPFSVRRGDQIEYALHLIFDVDGGVRMMRGAPSLSRGERSLALTVKLPVALFVTPQLCATVTVDGSDPPVPVIDVTAAREALRSALGVDIDLRVTGAGE